MNDSPLPEGGGIVLGLLACVPFWALVAWWAL